MPYNFDYHTHSCHSFDAKCSVQSMAEAAEALGLAELCFTDHLEFEYQPWNQPFDPLAQRRDIEAAQETCRVRLLRGAEIGLAPDPAFARQAWAHIAPAQPDFIIGSVHVIGEEDVFEPPFFAARTREQAYGEYLATIEAAIKTLPEMNILGHYDFVAKNSPFTPRPVRYADAPDSFDAILRYLAENGKGMEINTAVWRDAPGWGLDVLTRFAQLGGEFVTFGSDAHVPARICHRFREAYELALAAGIRYTAVFRERKPGMIKL